MAQKRNSPHFECQEGDFEGDLAGAISHVQLTGHLVEKETLSGTVVRVELEPDDDDPYGGEE